MQTKELELQTAIDRLRREVRDKGIAQGAQVWVRDVRAVLAALSSGGRGEAWRPIESAPKDRTAILAVFRADIYPALRPGREDLQQWNGVQAVLRHTGLGADGFDVGWAFAAPVGNGGFPDEWIAGWKPLDAPPTSNHAASAAANKNPENVQGEA